MSIKRVLYVAILSRGSTCVPRLQGLQLQGLDVQTLDTSGLYGSRFRLINSLTLRLPLTPRALALNRRLLEACETFKPDLVWMDKAVWVHPSVLRRVRKMTQFVVHQNTDDIYSPGFEFRVHKAGMRYYDLYMTTNRWNVIEIPQNFGVRTMRVGMGYDRAILEVVKPDMRETGAPLFFGGHWEPQTEKYIQAMRDNGLPIQVRGHNWWKAKNPSMRQYKPAEYLDYIRSTGSSRIALCFVSRRNRNDSASRTFEIPALGIFLLAIRTGEHSYLYRDGAEAVFFSDEIELLDKARYYLAHDEARRKIAEEGNRRCMELGLSWEEHVHREWRIVKKILLDGNSEFTEEDDRPFWRGFRCGVDWKD